MVVVVVAWSHVLIPKIACIQIYLSLTQIIISFRFLHDELVGAFLDNFQNTMLDR